VVTTGLVDTGATTGGTDVSAGVVVSVLTTESVLTIRESR